MDIKIQVPVDVFSAYVRGRNGYFAITALRIWQWNTDESDSDGTVDIEGIGKRGTAIKGGFGCLRGAEIDALCKAWIEARGGLAVMPGDDGVTALVTMCSGVVHEVSLSTDCCTLERLGERYVGDQDPDKWCYALRSVLLLDAPEESSQ